MKNKRFFTKGLLLAATLATGLTLGACSTTNEQGQVYAGDIEISDPFEDTNRAVFAFNNVVDDTVIHPVLRGYRTVLPSEAREGVHNFLINIGSPVNFINQLLQGDVDGAGDTFVRTAVNTLIGLGGLIDVAGHEGIEHDPEDFGQTLGTWGVGHGPYLVVPLLGPSSLRDYSGYFVDSMMDPIRIYYDNIDEMHIYYTKTGVRYMDMRNELMDLLIDLEASSIDYYASVRSTYYQNRAAMVKDQKTGDLDNVQIPDYDYYDEDY